MSNLHVLIIEDSEDDIELIVLELRREGYYIEYQHVASKEAMMAAMQSASFDIVLCDYKMPNFNGPEALRLWKEFGSPQPFIIVSGTIGEEAAVEALKMGVNDYVMKDNIAKLGPAVDRALREVEETRKRIEAERALKQSEMQYRTLVSNLPGAVYRCMMDQNWTMLFLSKGIADLSGYPSHEFINNKVRSYANLIVPEDREMVQAEVERAIEKREAFTLEYRIQHSDGGVRLMRERGVGVWDKDGNLSYLDGVLVDITREKEMEVTLKRSEEWFRGIFEESPIAINVFDKNGEMVLANRACLDMFGVKETSDLQGLNLFSDPNTADWVKERIKKDEQVRYESAFDFSKVHRDGLYETEKQGIMWLDAVLSPLRYGDAKELQGFIVQMQDITFQKRAEEELVNTLELLKKTFESQMDAVFIFGSSNPSKIIDANPASTKMFGYERQEMIGRISDFLHVSDKSYKAFIQQLIDSIDAVGFLQLENFDMKRKDGSVFPTELTVAPLVDELDRLFGFVSVVRDVTEHLEADRNLRESQELFRSTIESTGDGILVVSVNERLMHTNSRFVELWHVTENLLMSKELESLFLHMNSLLSPENEFLQEARQLLNNTNVTTDTLNLKNGKVIESYSAPINRDGIPIARVWSFRDITRIKKAEESARLYLDLMGHDIRNRLQAITMSVELGRMLGSNETYAEIFEEIESAARTCAKIVSKVKRTENLEQAPLGDRSLSKAARKCLDAISSEFKDVRIEESLSRLEMNVKADEYLEALLMNLLENAIVHNNRPDKQLWVRLIEENGGCLFSVSDNGPGLPDQRKDTLFNTKRRYGGVGLHIARQITDKYGGHLFAVDRVSGNPSEGLKFQLWLPRGDSTDV
jgi:PAS domain S-box-containing protein